jgi:hypothetical protein
MVVVHLTLGTPNTAADSRGSTAALFNLIGALNYTADSNSYDGALSPNTFKKANLNREPVINRLLILLLLSLITT